MRKVVVVRIGQSGGSVLVLRGGGWFFGNARDLRTPNRGRFWPVRRLDGLGLRLVRRLP